MLGPFVQLLEVVTGEQRAFGTVEAKPMHVALDRVDVVDVFFLGVRVVEPQVAGATEFFGNAEVETNGLGVANVQIAVRLWRKPCLDTLAIRTDFVVVTNEVTDEIR